MSRHVSVSHPAKVLGALLATVLLILSQAGPLCAVQFDLEEFYSTLDDIAAMRAEVLQAYEEHKARFQSPTFLEPYYLQAGAPRAELGVSLLVVNDKGHVVDFNEWHANALADALDIPFGGPAIPGMSTSEGDKMHIDEVAGKLSASMDFLSKHPVYYAENPPLMEMDYLSDGMKLWREHVAAYRQELETFLERSARFAVFNKFVRPKLYDRKLQELEAAYPDRFDDPLHKAKFTASKQLLDAWYEEKKNESLALRQYLRSNPLYRFYNVTLFNDLGTEFADRLELLQLNERYKHTVETLPLFDPRDQRYHDLKQEYDRLREALADQLEVVKSKYGPDWKEVMRDRYGQLPGGLISEDDAPEEPAFPEPVHVEDPHADTADPAFLDVVTEHPGLEHEAGVKIGDTISQ